MTDRPAANLPLYLRDPLFSCYVANPWVPRNTFIGQAPDPQPLPRFADARALLPAPHWQGHQAEIDCYWKAWEIAFGHLRTPTAENGFVAPYIDSAFNGHLFLWDSVFTMMFGRYGARVFDFQRTMDNLYCKQHPDGFICREIDEADGQDCFHRHDPSSTGPNVFAWGEWEHYRTFADRDRLAAVFPVLLAYHQWLRDYRTWLDGTYWSCGWASGTDNQPRVRQGYSPAHSPAQQAWLDACLHAILSARVLLAMGKELGMNQHTDFSSFLLAQPSGSANRPRPSVASLKPLAQLAQEAAHLEQIVNQRMWDDHRAFYFDLQHDGERNHTMSVSAYWALLAGIVPPDRLPRFLAHLADPARFNRPHRVPSLPADDPAYAPHGNYWCGGIWENTNYMVLRGLSLVEHDDLAHEIGLNHVQNVARVFTETGTIWENYAPESAKPGDPAQPDFVGFGGIGPVAVLLEYVFGLRPQAQHHRLVWDLRLLEEHSVQRYPIGAGGLLDLHCQARTSPADEPIVQASSNITLELELRWPGGRQVRQLTRQPQTQITQL
ncbi:MAG: trehalase family glycosidase [Phycisphaeraceae bacterium]